MNEPIFRNCNLTENEIFSEVLIFQGFRLKVSEDFFHRAPSCIFIVIVNRLRTAFLKQSRIMLTIRSMIKRLLVSKPCFYRLWTAQQ